MHLSKDFRYALRIMRKNRIFTLIAVSTLAFGIGASTLIFSTVEAVLLRPLPFRQPGRLMMVWETHPQVPQLELSIADFFDFHAQNDVFDGLAAYSFKGLENPALTTQDLPVRLLATDASQDLLPVLGIVPMLGRNFLPSEEQPGNDHEVILSNSLWQNRFGSDRTIIGKPITLDNQSYTVVGVLPPGMTFPEWAEILFPLSHAGDPTVRAHHSLETVGRLKPNVAQSQAASEIRTISERLQQQYPATNKSIGVKTMMLSEHIVGDTRPTLLLLLAAVGFVLLITCINISSLLLARAMTRQRESALRMALGASSRRLLQQFLTENFTIALVGGILGLVLTTVLIPFVRTWLGGQLPRSENISMNGVVLLFAAGVTLVAGLLLGIVPALQGWRFNVYNTLKEGSRDSGSCSKSLIRRVLVVSEISLAVIVLVSTGLVLRSFQRLLHGDTGFQAEHVMMMKLKLPQYAYAKQENVDGFFRDLLARLKSQPQIQDVGSTNVFPLDNDPDVQSRFLIEGTQPESGNFPVARARFISPGYFSTLKVSFISGRMFQGNDIGQQRVIVSESLVRQYFSGQYPIGKKIILGVMDPKPVHYEVVGVVSDIKDATLKAATSPSMYFPGFWVWETIVARTADDPAVVSQVMRHEVNSIDKNQPVDEIRAMSTLLSDSVARERISAELMSAFSLVALFLAALGVYGIMAYLVIHRTREIGIRMALGAHQGDVLRMIFNNGMFLVIIGLVLGFVGSMFTGLLLSSALYGVKSTDPITFIAVALVLMGVGGAAIYLPARRAARVDPLVSLRYE